MPCSNPFHTKIFFKITSLMPLFNFFSKLSFFGVNRNCLKYSFIHVLISIFVDKMTSIKNLARTAIILYIICFFTKSDGRPMM